ncbi:MAG: DUF962 domain-containing protein [Polyangiales bacterium]
MDSRIGSFEEFWPFYVGEHQSRACRAFHYLGKIGVLASLGAAAYTRQWWLLLLAPVVGYAASWTGHFGFERNVPAAFSYPWWSLRADFKMLGFALTGRMAREVTRLCG